ncbi:MAG: 50S ribosomal protein L6, partial [Myxococcales bacterium]|nr:50S ribosomal protein L6 [Myxococcales bacterium]
MTAQAAVRPKTEEGLRNSRVGKRPIALPKGVTASVKADRSIEVKGPKGSLVRPLPPGVDVKVEGGNVVVVPTVVGRDGSRFQGLARALTAGMVVGVAEGYTKTLQLVGTGYRAELKGQTLNLSLGFSHPIAFPLPTGIKCEIP